MPTISVFYGIIVLMHLTRKEHNPPHIHAIYGEYEATFEIDDGQVLQGEFPTTGISLVRRFIIEHKDELKEMWKTEIYKKIPPLK